MLKKGVLRNLVFVGILMGLVEACYSVSVEAPIITNPWVRSSTGPNTGAYCTIIGSTPDKLTSVECADATTVELHNHINENGVMKMRPVPFIEIGQEPVALKPGSLHIMLMGLKDSFQGKESISMTLHFENAGPIQVDFPIKKYE